MIPKNSQEGKGNSQEFPAFLENFWESLRVYKILGNSREFSMARLSEFHKFSRIMWVSIWQGLSKYNSWKFSGILGNYISLANMCPIHWSVTKLLTRHSERGSGSFGHHIELSELISSFPRIMLLSNFNLLNEYQLRKLPIEIVYHHVSDTKSAVNLVHQTLEPPWSRRSVLRCEIKIKIKNNK